VETTTRGDEALRLLQDGAPFDLVLCDVMMPETSGMDVYEQLRVTRPELADRMVFMTGGAFTSRATRFLASVPNARLEKPFRSEAVEALLGEGQLEPGALQMESGEPLLT
jgi:two-component system, NtrC family, sensor kinase